MPRRHRHLGPLFFGLALLTLVALTIHWASLLWRHESTGIDEQEKALLVAAHRVADRLGQAAAPPRVGVVTGHPRLEVVRLGTPSGETPRAVARLQPRWSSYGVRASPAAVDRLREKRRRRTVMLLGEGALAAILIGVFLLMLWRLLQGERQRRREIEAFISTISHELKTPLAGIKALLGTMELGYIPPDRQREFLEMGLREADRLEHLVENILIANRIRRSALQVVLKPLALEAFLREFQKHRNALMPNGQGAISMSEVAAKDIQVRADADKLRVVLENLADNAQKYGEDGEVRIRVRETETQILLDVEDDGIGFEPEQAEALFDGYRATIRSGGALVHGTGLGLGIARELTRAMGGELTAHSEGPGKGSRFTIALSRWDTGEGRGGA